MNPRRAIVIHGTDNVATALADLAAGDQVTVIGAGNLGTITARQPIPFGHKVALSTIEVGEAVIKYGDVIGRATQRITPGQHVHIHNVESLRGRGDVPP